MENQSERQVTPMRGFGKFTLGFCFIVAGVLLLLSKLGFYIPEWILSWPVLLIVLGFSFIIRSGRKKSPGFILLLVGLFFLPHEITGFYDLERFTTPAFFILLGVFLLFRKPSRFNRERWHQRWDQRWENGTGQFQRGGQPSGPGESYSAGKTSSEADPLGSSDESKEFLNDTAFLGRIKKNVFSKNFGGGDITAFFGGIELNLLNADITGTAVLDTTQLFGGITLLVPANWLVVTEVSAIFGGVEDKRDKSQVSDPQKKLVLKGTCIFGGLQIMSY